MGLICFDSRVTLTISDVVQSSPEHVRLYADLTGKKRHVGKRKTPAHPQDE